MANLMKTRKEKLIEAFIEREAVMFGEFTLTSGKRSNYYINVKKLITEPDVLGLIGELILETARSLGIEFDRVAGPELGAVPIATAVSLASGKPLVIVRKKPKGHGTRSRIEGTINRGDRILLVEDVTTTGGSVLKAADAVEGEGGEIAAICAVVDREEGAEENIKKAGYRFVSLVKVSELMKAAGR